MTKAALKHFLLALAVVSISLGAGCKKADNTTSDTATGASAPAATDSAMGASQ
jgi:hypothetical protein